MNDAPRLEVIVLGDRIALKAGENPGQQADIVIPRNATLTPVEGEGGTLYRLNQEEAPISIAEIEDLGKKVRTFGTTNLMDVATNWRTQAHMDDRYGATGGEEHVVSSSKHGNLVILGKGKTQLLALKRGLAADPNSPFGGILGFNTPLEHETAQFIDKMFIEGVIAPEYEAGTVELLTSTEKVGTHANRFILRTDIPSLREIDGKHKHRFIGNTLHRQGAFNYDYDLLTQACIVAGMSRDEKVLPLSYLRPEALKAAQFGVDAMALVSSNTILFSTEHALAGVGNGVGNRYFAARNARASMEESLYANQGNRKHLERALDSTPFTPEDFAEVLEEGFTLAACSDAFYPQPDALIESMGIDRIKALFLNGELKIEYTTRSGESKHLDMSLKRTHYTQAGDYDRCLIPDVIVQPGICLGDAKAIAIANRAPIPMVFMVPEAAYKAYLEGGPAPTGKRFFTHPAYE